ncbi:MAG: hypothetical protein LKF82_03850 [Acinetobacter populi]|uniref:hypothetical protein n=1 Tax=Acinetobacter populi TaxID=1582270 RepID=UPI00235433A3|nr:hypothetical protein [Acinetobacter populi]MCH4246960.1 hypothetical protein [Acinetobacter populi]
MSDQKEKLPMRVHVWCGWPLILVFIGGALGGGLAGLAYILNLKVYKSELKIPIKNLLNFLIGVSAFVLWFVVHQFVIAYYFNRQ